jgi:hypothetical protein
MTEDQKRKYESTETLRKTINQLKGRKFRLDCGHHVTFNHHLANDITIRNGKHLKIICSLCGY